MEKGAHSSEGICSFCGEKVSSRALARHLKKHLSEKAALLPKASKIAFHLLVTGDGCYVAGKAYFLHLLVDEEALLFELDDFLRAIWLECCGHLSSFQVKGRRYEYDWMDAEAPFGEDVEQLVSEVFYTGLILLYEYDFGSSTRLEIKVLGEYPLNSNHNIVLMSRNEAPHIKCDMCGKKPAVQLCSIHYGGEPQFFCTACGKKTCENLPRFRRLFCIPRGQFPPHGCLRVYGQ